MIQLFLEIVHRREGLVAEELCLEQSKEVFDHRIIIAIAFPGHALGDAFFLEDPLIEFHLVVPTLVRMEHQGTVVGDLLESLLQHVRHQAEVRGLR